MFRTSSRRRLLLALQFHAAFRNASGDSSTLEEDLSMTTAELVFDLFSEEYFNNPFEIYRRMRTEAPLYYVPTGISTP